MCVVKNGGSPCNGLSVDDLLVGPIKKVYKNCKTTQWEIQQTIVFFCYSTIIIISCRFMCRAVARTTDLQ